MHAFEYQEDLKISESDNSNIAIQELEDEAKSLQQQRTLIDDQRALLDLERAELEQQLSELEVKYALLNALSTQLDQREAILNSEYEVVRMTGERKSPRKAKNR
jgi:phage shock protein A